jgi:hypothetical protein
MTAIQQRQGEKEGQNYAGGLHGVFLLNRLSSIDWRYGARSNKSVLDSSLPLKAKQEGSFIH